MDAIPQKLWDRYEDLKGALAAPGSLAVAFSGGVDSTFLLWAAREALGDRAVALTAVSGLFPGREREEAAAFCTGRGIRQITVYPKELEIPGFAQNPPNRCYLCKKALFGEFLEAAAALGISAVAEGSNLDDAGDYRPGLQAVAELGIRSPLREAGFTKAEIRALSRALGLPTWDKPSYACLASRIPYGEPVTREKLRRVEQAEQQLLELGFRQHRVRIHGDVARIELPPEDFSRMLEEETRLQVSRTLRGIGFSYVSLDLQGYRTGSMNETLPQQDIKRFAPERPQEEYEDERNENHIPIL